LEQLDGVRRKGQDAEHSLGLKPDNGLLLKVEGPLEAAEIEIDADAHEESLPEAGGLRRASVDGMRERTQRARGVHRFGDLLEELETPSATRRRAASGAWSRISRPGARINPTSER
jgi:hypothetical protein